MRWRDSMRSIQPFAVQATHVCNAPMKILIADDHRLIIEAVKVKLSELQTGIEFVVAMGVAEMMRVASDDLDLALVDLNMPGAKAHEHIDALRRSHPSLPIVVLSGSEDAALVRRLLELGVLGFIPKAYSAEVMLSAVRLVLAGGVYVPPMMLATLPAWVSAGVAQSERARPTTSENAAAPSPHEPDPLRHVLTERQVEVLHLLSQGKPNKLIGRSLNISEGTVKIHLAAIFRALNVRNRTEAVIAARGMTTPP